MTRINQFCILVLTVLLGVPVAAQPVSPEATPQILSPLPVRGEFLLTGGYLSPMPSLADAIAARWEFELRLTTANTFAKSNSISEQLLTASTPHQWRIDDLRSRPENVFVADGELQRATLTVRRGLSPKTEIFAAVPILSLNGAWADKLIENFHIDLRLGSDGRSAVTRDRQFIYLKAGDRELIRSGAIGAGLGDVTLGVKQRLPDYRATAFAVELLLEIPSGNETLLFGSGAVDSGINFLASRRGERSAIHASTGISRLGKNSLIDVPARWVVTTTLGYSRMLWPSTAASVQMTSADSPFRDLYWPELAARFYQYSVGIQHEFERGKVIHLALIENAVNYENSADFGLQVGLAVTR